MHILASFLSLLALVAASPTMQTSSPAASSSNHTLEARRANGSPMSPAPPHMLKIRFERLGRKTIPYFHTYLYWSVTADGDHAHPVMMMCYRDGLDWERLEIPGSSVGGDFDHIEVHGGNLCWAGLNAKDRWDNLWVRWRGKEYNVPTADQCNIQQRGWDPYVWDEAKRHPVDTGVKNEFLRDRRAAWCLFNLEPPAGEP